MKKFTQKAVAFLTVAVMIISMLPVISLPAFAKTQNEFDGKMELDYDALFENAYIVWSSGSTTAKNWTFTFRGEQKTVAYDAARCFKSFSTAYTAFTKKGATAVVTETPVFVLIGNVTTTTTIYGNIIVLGANAGVSPNAAIDIQNVQATNPTSTWAAATRGTETVINGYFKHGNNASYDTAAKEAGVKEYNIIIDGVQVKDDSTYSFIQNTHSNTANSVARTINCYVKNTKLDFNKNTIYAFTASGDKVNRQNFSLENVRMAGSQGKNNYSVHKGLFDKYAAAIAINGLYYENDQYPVCYTLDSGAADSIDLPNKDFSFTLKNSIIRGTGANQSSSTLRFFRFGLAEGTNEITFENNILYKIGYTWGFTTFKSNSDANANSTIVNFTKNLVFDQPSTAFNTLFEGGEHVAGPVTLNISYNRIIGYKNILMSLGTYPFNTIRGSLRGTCAYNYHATSFSSVNDTAGLAPSYSGTSIDHYKFSSLYYTSDTNKSEYVSAKYYTDYKMLTHSDRFDITECDFYDDLDYISINNTARVIRLRVAKGVTVSGLSKNYGFKFHTTPSSVSFSKTSLTSSASTSTMTVTINGSSVKYTIYAEAQPSTTVSYKNIASYDPTGTLSSSYLYLYSPSGATTASFNGVTFDFSGRSYKTMAEIFSAAGTNIPQIIIPSGTYSAVTLTKPCQLYGEAWLSPATGGVGVDNRVPGDAWEKDKETIIQGITLSSGVGSSYKTNSVTLAGIALTGNLTDTARSYPINLTIKNSIINGGSLYLENSATKSKASGSVVLSGVKVAGVSSEGSLFVGNMPYSTTFDNVEVGANAVSKLVSNWNTSLSSSSCALTIKNSYFDEVADLYIGDITNGIKFSNATVTLSNNAFLKTTTGRHYPSLLGITPSLFKSVTVDGNWFVNKGSSFHTIFGNDSGSVTFNNNRLIGFDLGSVSADKSNNYYAPYSYDYATETNGRPYGSTYYLDSSLKVKNSALKVSSVTGGDAIISEAIKTIYVKATGAVALTFSTGKPYTVWADKACTEPATLSGEGTYYVKTIYNDAAFIYNVRIDGGDDEELNSTFANDVIGANVLYVSTDIDTSDYGKRVYFDFEGTSYSAVAGITAFANVRDALEYAKEKGNSDPKILLGEFNDVLSVTAKAKIYGGNYNTIPYIKTQNADLDWTYNENYDTNKTTVSNIQIGPEASGYIEINGVEMKGYYLDVCRGTSSYANVKLKNLLVNKTSADTRVLFDLNGNNVIANDGNTESFTVENAFIQSATSTRLLYEFYPANVTFDGLYLDCKTFNMNVINYTKSSGTNTTLTFKNSNLRNYTPETTTPFLFQGDDSAVTSGESKKLVFENNVLYDFTFSNSGIIAIQGSKLTDIIFKNNKILSSKKTYPLVYNQANASNAVGLRFEITDNLLLGINPTSNIGSSTNINLTNSVVARNHTVSTYTTEGSGSPITIKGSNTLTESEYAIDDSMQPIYKTDFALEDIYSEDNAIYEKTISGNKVSLRIPDGYAASSFDWIFGDENITPVFYKDANCTTTINAALVKKGSTYYVKGSYKADDGKTFLGDAYTVTFADVTTSYPLFNHNIIADDAILVDSTVNSSSTYHNASWDGKTYSFVVGENVFATLDAAIAKGGAGKSYLIKDFGGIKGNSEYSSWLVKTPGKYYTQNFDKTPFIASDKASDPDGSEWTANIGEGKFNTANGITVKSIVLNTAAAGDYEFHGFTITNAIQDDDMLRTARSSDNDINVIFNNTYINKTYSDNPVFNVGTHFMLDASGEKLGDTVTAFNDSMTLKNTYFVNKSTSDLIAPNSSSNSDIKYNVNLWTHVVIDGMFADYKDSNVTDITSYIGSYGKDYSFTVKNPNMRNHTANWWFEGHNGFGVDYGYDYAKSRSMIFTDNIFYNFTFYSTASFLQYKASYFNEIVFDNNYIYAPANSIKLTNAGSGNAVHPDPYVTITNNVMLGINPDYNFGRWVTWDQTTVKDNYCVATRPASTDAPSYNGQKFVMTVSNWKYDTDGTTKVYYQTNGDYWVDSTKLYRPYDINPMTLNGEDFNTPDSEGTITLTYDTTVFNLNDYLVNNCNKLTVVSGTTTITDITKIAATGDLVLDIEVVSYDGTSDIQNRTIYVTHAGIPEISTVSATLYNGITMNFKASGLVGTEKMVFTVAGKTTTESISYKEGTYSVFTIDLDPHMMTEHIKATLMSGSETLDTYTVTFRDYCDGIMFLPDTSTQTYNLCVSILNYGAAAQQYKNYNVDDLANMFLTEDEATIPTASLTNSINAKYATVYMPETTWAAHSLILDEAVQIKLGFKANTPVSKLSVKVEGANGYTKTLTDCFWYENGKYYFIFDDFNVIQSSDVFYFTIMRGNIKVSDTLAYSAESYAYTVANSSSATSLKNLTNALMDYVIKANAYADSL